LIDLSTRHNVNQQFNNGFDLAGSWRLFLKDARQIMPQLVERPVDLNKP